jgi:hypothetical protein
VRDVQIFRIFLRVAEWIDRAALVALRSFQSRALLRWIAFLSLREPVASRLEVARRSENRHNDGDARVSICARVRDCVTESARFSQDSQTPWLPSALSPLARSWRSRERNLKSEAASAPELA